MLHGTVCSMRVMFALGLYSLYGITEMPSFRNRHGTKMRGVREFGPSGNEKHLKTWLHQACIRFWHFPYDRKWSYLLFSVIDCLHE
jgi:hypothetical protein